MSDVRKCPTCGAHAIFSEVDEGPEGTYIAVQDEEAFRKIKQLKGAVEKFKTRCEELEEKIASMDPAS